MAADNETKGEYLDLSENMRTYINVRFAQLTVFVGITAALLNVVFTQGNSQSVSTFALKIIGLLSTIMFWIMEERAADFYHHFRRRAIELENSLGYKQYTLCPKRRVITATNATRMLYFAVFFLWLIALFFPSLFS